MLKKDYIIIERMFAIGDVIMAEPTLRIFKEMNPNIKLLLKTGQKCREVLKNSPDIFGIYSDAGIPSDYDLMGITTGEYEKDAQLHPVDVFLKRINLNPDNIPIEKKKPCLYLSEQELKIGKELLDNETEYIGLSVSANDNYRSWPIEKVNEISSLLLEAGYRIVWLDKNKFDCKFEEVLNLTGKLTLREFFGVIANCRAIISLDTGTAHIAGALDIPFIAVPANVQPEIRFKYYNNWDYVGSSVHCQFCWGKGTYCKEQYPECLKVVSAKEIIQKLGSLLKLKEEEEKKILIKIYHNGLGDFILALPALKKFYKTKNKNTKIYLKIDSDKEKILQFLDFKICDFLTQEDHISYFDRIYDFTEYQEHHIERFVKHKSEIYSDFLGIVLKDKDKIIEFNKLSSKKKKIGLCISTISPLKDWRPEYNAQLLELLSKNFEDYEIVIIDKKQYQTRLNTNVKNLSGKTSVVELIDLIGELSLLITPDTAPIHIAGVLGIPTVGIFGCTDPNLLVNQYKSVIAIRDEDLYCLPCHEALCYTKECMKHITPERILNVAKRILHKDDSSYTGNSVRDSRIQQVSV